MREIKFRAWDKVNDIWVEEYIIIDNKGELWIWKDPDIELGDQIKDGNIEIMFYTGLKDKNGKEIYEGDIVNLYDSDRGANPNPEKSVVQWDNNNAYWAVNGILGFIPINDIEIIGNIYENPEILKGNNE